MAVRPWDYHHDALPLRGALYEPQGSSNGRAVLVVHEADGIGQNVRRRCAMLAELGYVAAAADMHGHGRVLGEAEIPPAMERFRNDAALVRGRARAAVDALIGETHLPIAAIGYCFGGFAVLELARAEAPLAAAVSFHGLLTSRAPAQPGDVLPPILVATGALDPLVPQEDVVTFEAEMRSAGADWHLLTHGRARHSFTNAAVGGLADPRMAYDAAADAISWAAALTFLDAAFAPEGGSAEA